MKRVDCQFSSSIKSVLPPPKYIDFKGGKQRIDIDPQYSSGRLCHILQITWAITIIWKQNKGTLPVVQNNMNI